jgi:hypothetical protein
VTADEEKVDWQVLNRPAEEWPWWAVQATIWVYEAWVNHESQKRREA